MKPVPFVDFSTYNSSNPFGQYDPKFYPKTHHHIGSDFVVPVGTPIRAPFDGQVLKVQWSDAKGNVVIFFHSAAGVWGLEFCHLSKTSLLRAYKQGDIIGYSGNTGSATTAPHLHVVQHKDCRVTKNYEELVDEAAFFKLVHEGRFVDTYQWHHDRF